jgi:hypothetical protein
LEQPIYAGDVIKALGILLAQPSAGVLELGGPESVSRRALIHRCAQANGDRKPRVISLPVGLGYLIAGFFEVVLASPPVTRAMLELLDHDDQIESETAAELNLTLTPLSDVLRQIGESV